MASETPFDPCDSEEAAECIRQIAGAGAPLATLIHPADEMFRFDLAVPRRNRETASVFYFATGAAIFRTVSEIAAWRFGGLEGVRSLLDFASGYGRATRFIVRAIPPSRVTAAEIDPAAVRFQEETFGVNGCVSGHDPVDLALEGPFDFILAVSLFSHLPPESFERWLARLYGLVGEGGALAFSTHGPLLPDAEAMPASGIAFRPVSETTRLDGAEYGTSWVSEDFVRRAAERVSRGRAALSAHPLGLGGHQDLYVMSKPPQRTDAPLRLARDPLGALELATIENGVVAARGWASGDRNERPPDVRLLFGAEVRSVSPGRGGPGERRDWSFEFPLSAPGPDRIVRIEAESEQGATRLLVAETLRPYLPG